MEIDDKWCGPHESYPHCIKFIPGDAFNRMEHWSLTVRFFSGWIQIHMQYLSKNVLVINSFYRFGTTKAKSLSSCNLCVFQEVWWKSFILPLPLLFQNTMLHATGTRNEFLMKTLRVVIQFLYRMKSNLNPVRRHVHCITAMWCGEWFCRMRNGNQILPFLHIHY